MDPQLTGCVPHPRVLSGEVLLAGAPSASPGELPLARDAEGQLSSLCHRIPAALTGLQQPPEHGTSPRQEPAPLWEPFLRAATSRLEREQSPPRFPGQRLGSLRHRREAGASPRSSPQESAALLRSWQQPQLQGAQPSVLQVGGDAAVPRVLVPCFAPVLFPRGGETIRSEAPTAPRRV